MTRTPAPPHSDREVEWQFEAQDLQEVLRWAEQGPRRSEITPGPTLEHVDTYFDTRDRRLHRAGYSVRVRRARRGPAEATFKSLSPGEREGPRVRLELAELVDRTEPPAVAVMRARGEVGRRVRALIGRAELEPLFELQTRRRAFALAAGGELLLDETCVRDGARAVVARLRRVEVEVPETLVDAVAPLVAELRTALDLQPAALSKYETALATTGRRPPVPSSGSDDDFAPPDRDRRDTPG